MNLVDELLQKDISEAMKKKTGIVKSKRLAEVLGRTEPVEIQIKEIRQRRVNEIIGMQFDKKGKRDFGKIFDANLVAITEGVTYPPMNDKRLMEKFRADSPKQLAEFMFGGEVGRISDAILELSGVKGDEDDEEDDGEDEEIGEIKN